MKNEILDEKIPEVYDRQGIINRIIGIVIFTVGVFFLIELLRPYVPERGLEQADIPIKIMGLIIVMVVASVAIILPTQLNRIKPPLSIIQIVFLTGVIIFGIELLFKITQGIIVSKSLSLDYFRLVQSALLLSLFGMLIANIRIHKLRGKSILLAVLILLGLWIAAGYWLSS